jgi:riboflavin synthase
MFTGLIEEIGKISSITAIAGGKRLKISASKILSDLKVDDSVAVNGICLTATNVDNTGFTCEAVGVTLTKTTLQNFSVNEEVNLERAVRLADRLGGHLVQGHINGIGIIKNISKLGDNYFVELIIPDELKKYLVEEGSIAVDGISLTIAKLENNTCGLSIIPHTWNNTIIKNKRTGSKVNIEIDVIAKYVEKLLIGSKVKDDKFTDAWFKNLGY